MAAGRDTSKSAEQTVSLDDVAAEKLSPTILKAIQHILLEGAELVEESTIGGFVGVVDGQLIAKLQLRLPIKKTLLFLGSLAAVIWLIAPYISYQLP